MFYAFSGICAYVFDMLGGQQSQSWTRLGSNFVKV